MKKSATPLILLLSFGFSLYALVFWFPARVAPIHAGLAPQEVSAQDGTRHDPDRDIPDSLLAYIQQTRPTPVTSDLMGSDELIETFEDLQEEYADKDSRLSEALQENLVGYDFDPAEFEVPEGLEDVVGFWVNVFGVYDKDQVIFHHPEHVTVVYSVLDFADLADTEEDTAESIRNQMVREENNRLALLLKNLGDKLKDPQTQLTREESRIAQMLSANRIDPETLAKADSVFVRNGFAHRFRQSIALSGQYMDEMERIFRERGLPVQLTRVPFVESSFNTNAYSSANAAGLWQFIPDTGRMYLQIDEHVDERLDPILATHAAAAHLSREYKLLKSWPLTINAYNTGPGRMQQAVQQLQTQDIATIVRNFKGAGYGFDSRNYFPEILAAIEVYDNRHKYFGDVQPMAPVRYEYVEMPADTNLLDLFEVAGLDGEIMREINTALKPEVLDGVKNLPKGYRLKILPQDKDSVYLAAKELKDAMLLGGLGAPKPQIPATAGLTTPQSSGDPEVDGTRSEDLAENPVF